MVGDYVGGCLGGLHRPETILMVLTKSEKVEEVEASLVVIPVESRPVSMGLG
jgi:hypothetical protein